MDLLKTLPTILLLLGGLADGMRRFFGECPQPSIMNNLTLKNIMGPWYLIKEYQPPEADKDEVKLKCQVYNFSDSGNGSIEFVFRTIISHNLFYYEGEKAGKLERFKGSGQSQNQARFTINFAGETPIEDRSNYKVLHADNSCVIVWDCVVIHRTSVNGTESLENSQMLWIMTRARLPTESVKNHCNKMLENVFSGHDDRSLKDVSQEGCDL